MYTREFLSEALAFLKPRFPTIYQKIVDYENGRPPGTWRHAHPSTMFTHLATAVIFQKVNFSKTTEIKAQLSKEIGYVFTSKMLNRLGRKWFEREALGMETSTVNALFNLIEWCLENGDPATPDDVLEIQKNVKGIGPWTVHVALLYWSIARVPGDDEELPDDWSLKQIGKIRTSRALQRSTDVYPHLITSWDPVVRKGLYVLLGQEMFTGRMRQLAKELGKYGGIVSLYMWWNYNHKKIKVPETYVYWKLVNPKKLTT